MGRAVLVACLPWLALLVVSLFAAYLLVRFNGSGIRFRRLWQLHRDQDGSAQSLSFVLTLPVFVMIMLFIVQVSQLMIGTIVVHYAAYAAARSAIVWIPADLGTDEGPNCISFSFPDPDAPKQDVPILDPTDPNYGPSEGGMTFLVEPGSPKFEKIRSAAVLACTPICPSRDVGLELSGQGALIAEILKEAYGSMVPQAEQNARIPTRLENKLAYAMENTFLEIRFYHKNEEPPLLTYLIPDDEGEFYPNEIGWQDLVTVTVRHDLALLPGPGRLLARYVARPDGTPDEVARHIVQKTNVYTYPLKATTTMGNEGEKPVIPYVHDSVY
ncbi:MAG TPA: TadE/TadG family type IV pilus assembly protein [Thermoguttaceae bacterium]|nr:TadE/TadG family type IV pilus assembly protein [Thermoguttaceae bacterium]